jgi:hypothetical protein
MEVGVQRNFRRYSSHGECCTQVPGFTHPVTDLYLGDILMHLGFQVPEPDEGPRETEAESLAKRLKLPPQQAEAVYKAIELAFKEGGQDKHFEALLEVRRTSCILTVPCQKPSRLLNPRWESGERDERFEALLGVRHTTYTQNSMPESQVAFDPACG